ncbi:MAG TPA: HAD family hydrolase, partial [Firmicutes bacterium]|nr:HAD family hydrolase [Bacillota bacterium]
LLDSMGVWEKVDYDFLAKRILAVPDEYVKNINAMSFREAAQYTIDLFHLNEKAADIIEEWNNMGRYEYSYNIRLKPHAREYLEYLKKAHIKLGTATSLPELLYEPVLKNNEIFDLFDALTSTAEVSRGKEYPDVYRLAAKKLAVRPGDCIAFDDTLEAISGMKAAGLRVYGVYDPYSDYRKEAIQALADGFIYNFAEMFRF